MSTWGRWDAIWRLFAGPATPDSGGQFIGEIVARLLPDGRNLKLVDAFPGAISIARAVPPRAGGCAAINPGAEVAKNRLYAKG